MSTGPTAQMAAPMYANGTTLAEAYANNSNSNVQKAKPTTSNWAIDSKESAKSLLWFWIIALLVVGIAMLIYWIVWSQDSSRERAEFKCVQTRELDVTRELEVQGNVNVSQTATLEHQVIRGGFAWKPKHTSQPELKLSGCHSTIVLENSTSTPINVTLPLGATVSAGYVQVLYNSGIAPTFVVQPQGTDTLESGSVPITITARSAMFMCLGRSSTSSVTNWVQLKFI